MFRRIMKFQALKNAVCLGRREGFRHQAPAV